MGLHGVDHTALPLPSDRPVASVVIYDSHCRICSAQINRLARWDRRRQLTFLSLHDSDVYRRYPDLSHDQLMDEMVVVDPQGVRHHGAAAFRYLSRVVPRLWPLALLMHVPGTLPLWQWLYRRFARLRYAFGRRDACADGACEIHFRKR
jgi:predicted DCC family thiol-disulfide oxidoreductase YuxK